MNQFLFNIIDSLYRQMNDENVSKLVDCTVYVDSPIQYLLKLWKRKIGNRFYVHIVTESGGAFVCITYEYHNSVFQAQRMWRWFRCLEIPISAVICGLVDWKNVNVVFKKICSMPIFNYVVWNNVQLCICVELNFKLVCWCIVLCVDTECDVLLDSVVCWCRVWCVGV